MWGRRGRGASSPWLPPGLGGCAAGTKARPRQTIRPAPSKPLAMKLQDIYREGDVHMVVAPTPLQPSEPLISSAGPAAAAREEAPIEIAVSSFFFFATSSSSAVRKRKNYSCIRIRARVLRAFVWLAYWLRVIQYCCVANTVRYVEKAKSSAFLGTSVRRRRLFR